MRLEDFKNLGGHMAYVRPLVEVLRSGAWHADGAPTARQWVMQPAQNPWPLGQPPQLG
jgi:hypothetical protein